ncbi:endonuclease III domain-containing protein [Chloroflexota bacterium]
MNNSLEEIYVLLRNEFGYRNWWPADTREEVIIGAILTQNVSWRNVKKAIANLKASNLLSLDAIHNEDPHNITPLIKSTRFYNQKVQKLKNFTEFFFSKYRGSLCRLFENSLSDLRKELLSINGLGEETVDSILLYAGSKEIFVIDAYTKRIFSRIGIINEKILYKECQDFFMKNLDPDVKLYNDYHAQIVFLGHHLCRTINPECHNCPLRQLCKFYGNNI